MPRVAADQALTGPAIPLRQAAPGDLLFYHTDPTDPRYISHVAIYLGHGLMEQAPEPGMNVEVVPLGTRRRLRRRGPGRPADRRCSGGLDRLTGFSQGVRDTHSAWRL